MDTVHRHSHIPEREFDGTAPGDSVAASRPDRDSLSTAERWLVGLEIVLALGALVGGGGMLLDTSGRGQGLPVDLLDGTPFGSFLIPGVVLVLLNGFFPAVVAIRAVRRRRHADLAHLAVAVVLAGSLAGETFFIGLASWMQPFLFAYAIVIGVLAGRLLRVPQPSKSTGGTGGRGDQRRVVVRGRTNQGLALAVTVLGAGLALNSVLGPLLSDTIRYPFSETLRNQTIGLEAVTLCLVAPLCVVSGFLVWRGHPVGPMIAFGPAAYAAYMLVQYLIGPGYLYYPRVLPFHLALFILSGVVAVAAWSAVDVSALPPMTSSMARRRAKVLFLLAGFVFFRYLPALTGSWGQAALDSEFSGEPAMFWSILVLDLGIVVPAVIGVASSLRQRKPTGVKGMYAVLSWFALVPPSVATMALTMLLRNDPHKSIPGAVVLVTAAVAFSSYSIAVFLPVVRGVTGRTDQAVDNGCVSVTTGVRENAASAR